MTIEELHHLYLTCSGISTDTRNLRQESLFIALKGASFNGNQFALEALAKGCSFALVSDAKLKEDARYGDRIIVVRDTLETLQELATYHRRHYAIPVIAITGTNGKTTTKELTAEVLQSTYRTVKTEGNLNNHIGVPLTLLRIAPTTEIAIIEMGANHLSDIQELCGIAEPSHGIVTNIGLAHLEGFGSKEGVAKAKGELYVWLRNHAGTIFINEEDTYLTTLLCSIDPGVIAETVRYGTKRVPDSPSLFGSFNKENMKPAAAIGEYFNVNRTDIDKALKAYSPANMRSQHIATAKENEIILDAYNANPSSMKAAIEAFSEIKTRKPKWLIIGDMKELGDESHKEHEKILKDISFFGFTNVILIGEAFYKAHEQVKRYATFATAQDFKVSPFASSIRGSLILIKGSNSMRLWEIADIL